MVPPPDSTGDAFPDFDKMTLEEQMAWLESLARRQGAKAEEFTTAANLDIPLPENPVIDEPGYVPYSISEKPAAKPSEPPPAPEVIPEIREEPEISALEEEFEAAPAMSGMSDPMHWLNSLAIQPDMEIGEGELAEPERDALAWDLDLEEEAPDLDFLSGLERETFDQEEIPVREEPPPAAFPELAQAAASSMPDSDDLLGGVDPMLWLESLAARQGASRDQLTTSANLEIEEVPEGTVIDEPGYIPYNILTEDSRPETSFRARELEPEAPEGAPPTPETPAFEPPGIPEPEFLQIPEEELFEEPALEAAGEGLSWLESLAAEPDQDVSELLALGGYLLGSSDSLAEESFGLPESEPEAESFALADASDPLAGMSDEQVAYAQAHGLLTGEQELAWLKRQAAKLAEVRESEESRGELVESDDLMAVSPAEPGMLPDWLQQMREESEQEAAPTVEKTSALIGDADLSSEPTEFSEWLEEPATEAAPDLSELQLGTEADVEKLWAETVGSAGEPEEESEPESELVAFLEGTLVPEEPDQLAEALDAEYERRLAGDESEPAWYAEAVVRSSQLEPEDLSAGVVGKIIEPAEPEEATEEVLTPAVPMEDMPDWLREVQPEPPLAVAEELVPDWLMESEQELPAMPGLEDIPDWLKENVEVPGVTGLEWLTAAVEEGLEPEPALLPEDYALKEPEVPLFVPETAEPEPPSAPEPEPTVVASPPPRPEIAAVPMTAAPIPAGELFEQYGQRLAQNPNDFASRLALARALRVNQQVASSLDHYEVLIDNAQLLQDVSSDLSILVDEQPGVPRMRRLLGDAYMRQGMLREALDAYRSALDQL